MTVMVAAKLFTALPWLDTGPLAWQSLLPIITGGVIAAVSGLFTTWVAGHIRDQRLRSGTRRQIRTLLRWLVRSVKPAFSLYQSLQWHDTLRTYERIMECISNENVAIALSDDEYDLIDTLVSSVGKSIALVQAEEVRASGALGDRKAQPHETAAYRLFWAQAFYDVVKPLGKAVGAFGDALLLDETRFLAGEAERAIKWWTERLAQGEF